MSERRARRILDEQPIEKHSHKDPKTGNVLTSPFEVAAFTIRQEFLGEGLVVGQVDDGGVPVPVIDIHDRSAHKVVSLLGSECYWRVLDEEIEKKLMDPRMKERALGAYEYVQGLDTRDQASPN
jgi:hypothetical protein